MKIIIAKSWIFPKDVLDELLNFPNVWNDGTVKLVSFHF